MKPLFSLILITVLILTTHICSANPIPIPPDSGENGSGEISLIPFLIYLFDFTVDAVVLVITFIILRKSALIKSLKFIVYAFLVATGGIIIDWASLMFSDYISSLVSYRPYIRILWFSFYEWTGIVSFGLLSFALLFLYNYWLSLKLFKFNKKEAIVIGTTIGIFTNPVFFSLIISIFQYLFSGPVPPL